MVDAAAIGEILIDLTETGEEHHFTANPGGAPANMLSQLSVLGKRTAFMGMVGKDSFGNFLRGALENQRIDTSGLLVNGEIPTTLAVVSLSRDGERSFSFYRNPGADIMFGKEDVRHELIDGCRIFHFGGVSLAAGPAREATLYAAEYALEKGRIVSYDPNYRPPLWPSEDEAREYLSKGVPLCNILKVSEEEARLITGLDDIEDAGRKLLGSGPDLVLVTMGKHGCTCFHQNLTEHIKTYGTRVVDTTGSGDSFFGAVLYKMLAYGAPVPALTAERLREAVNFGNAAGASCATRYGALMSMPDLETIERCMRLPKL